MESVVTRSTPARGALAWMAQHPVTANLLMVVLLLGGFISGTQIKQEVFPNFTLDSVTVSIAYPGASPEEVERGIVMAVEDAVQDLEAVEEVNATAREGSATIWVEMIEDGDIQKLAQDIRNAVDRNPASHAEADEAPVHILSRRRHVVTLAVHGRQTEGVLREYAEFIRDRLLSHDDIRQVDLVQVRDHEISVEIPQDTLRTYGLTIGDVADLIRRSSVELPAGAIKGHGGDVLVRVTDRRDFGHEFGRIPIVTAGDGTQVLLEDIAAISDGFEESDRWATYNGDPAVMMEVYRIGDQTPIEVAAAVRAMTAQLNQQLPEGLTITLRRDRSQIYRQRLDLMLRNGSLGLCLVFLLLALFLEIRLAFWVSLGIPISFLGSLLLLPTMDISINMISMFAFIITLGIVVDDAIVAGENIYHHRQQGVPWMQAAIAGVREIAMPVTFSVLTNMITFLPLLFIPGVLGKIFKQIPLVVMTVFAISLVESLLILPAHLGHGRDSAPRGPLAWLFRGQQRFSRGFSRLVHTVYGPLLKNFIRMRYATVAGGAVIFALVVGYVQSGRMGFDLFPKIESDFAMATAVLPYGSAVERTVAIQQRLVAAAKLVEAENGGEDLVEGIYARINANETTVRIYLTPPDRRPVSTAEVTRLWREKVGRLAGLESLRFESDAGGPGRGRAMSIEMSHRNMNTLEQASQELAHTLSFFPQTRDISDGFAPGKQQIDFQVTPEARSLGLRARDIARQVRYAYYGATVLRQQRGRNEISVVVRLPRAERESEFNLDEMILRAPNGAEIPLAAAVTRQRGRAYTDIDRRNGRRVVTVKTDVRPRNQAGRIKQELNETIMPELMDRYPGLTWSFVGRQADMQESLSSLKKGMALALLAIFIMLAVPFNSYIQPVIIMAAIPFGIVGAVIGHLIMGYGLSLMSLFGVVALSGVVVNDSLVLIHLANRNRDSGMTAFDAVLQAGIQRFRPILLTTLTTFGGLAPMIFETSRQARFLIPMAISLGFGILFATLIILVLVPAFYLVLADFQTLLGGAAPKSGHKALDAMPVRNTSRRM